MEYKSNNCSKCLGLIKEQEEDLFIIKVHRIGSIVGHTCTSQFNWTFHKSCLPRILKADSNFPAICDCTNTSLDNPNIRPIDSTNSRLLVPYPIIHGGKNSYRSNPTISTNVNSGN